MIWDHLHLAVIHVIHFPINRVLNQSNEILEIKTNLDLQEFEYLLDCCIAKF